MNRLAMSPAAAGLLRGILARAGVPRDRILLSSVRSVDWQSLTLVGERHEFELRFPGPDSASAVERLCDGLEEAEFQIAGQIVVEIALAGEPAATPDGSITIAIEALTVED